MVSAGYLTFAFDRLGKLTPLHGNVLVNASIGQMRGFLQVPIYFPLAVTFLGFFGAFLLLRGIFRNSLSFLRQSTRGFNHEDYLMGFVLVLVGTYFAPLPLLGLGDHGFYDRYLIVFLSPLLLALVTGRSEFRGFRFWSVGVAVGAITTLSITAFSVAAVHDYLAWNRVLWTALSDLMRDGSVAPERIDGGFEFRGWYLYNNSHDVQPGKNDEYYVGGFRREGYRGLKTYSIDRWLPWGHGDIIIQRRSEAKSIDPNQ
jgi:hypothetical protein